MKLSRAEFIKMRSEFQSDYSLVVSVGDLEVYDDHAGGGLLDTKTREAWCLGEMGSDEGDFPPDAKLRAVGLRKSDLPLGDSYWKKKAS